MKTVVTENGCVVFDELYPGGIPIKYHPLSTPRGGGAKGRLKSCRLDFERGSRNLEYNRV